MGRGEFSPQEIDVLRKSPYVVLAEARRVVFSAQFKEHFAEQYAAGERPTAIFRDAGIDPKILGDKRIERATARWKQMYGDAPRKRPVPRPRDETISVLQATIDEKNRRILELEAQVAALQSK